MTSNLILVQSRYNGTSLLMRSRELSLHCRLLSYLLPLCTAATRCGCLSAHTPPTTRKTQYSCSIFHLIRLMREVTRGWVLFIPSCIRWLRAAVFHGRLFVLKGLPVALLTHKHTTHYLFSKKKKKKDLLGKSKMLKFICCHHEDNFTLVS